MSPNLISLCALRWALFFRNVKGSETLECRIKCRKNLRCRTLKNECQFCGYGLVKTPSVAIFVNPDFLGADQSCYIGDPKRDAGGSKIDSTGSKRDIGGSKRDIDGGLLSPRNVVEQRIASSHYSPAVKNALAKIVSNFFDQTFDRLGIMVVIGCSRASGTRYISILLKLDVIEPVSGLEKGKYRFRRWPLFKTFSKTKRLKR